MPNLIRNFVNGMMEKDLDERLIPPGKYRHAENVLILNSETADVGAVNKSYSNKQLTNYDFGENPKCLLGLADETNDLLYYFIVSDSGCFLAEWDHGNQILSIVLGDTRPEDERVLDLKEDFLITGVQKIITEDKNKGLLLFTDDNMQPCCINIERAKSYGINGFTKEDIYLIKKPPRYAPTTQLTYTNDKSNNLEERFLLFAYRYKYLDGEYSALSSYSNYNFNPKKFDLDYYTLVNKGMINKFNAVSIGFNTGEKQVTDIQIITKETSSNNLYIVETFNKENEGWGHGETKNIIFSNQKLYSILPEKELFRSFDNVPIKAKTLSLVGNIPVFGNYVEGYDIKDADGNKIVIDYKVSLISREITNSIPLEIDYPSVNILRFQTGDNVVYVKDYVMYFFLSINVGSINIYENEFTFFLSNNYSTLLELVTSIEFQSFLNIVNNHFITNYNNENQYEINPNYALDTDPSIEFVIVSGVPTLQVSPIVFEDTANSNAIVNVDLIFNTDSDVSISDIPNSSSVKSNSGVEVGLLYLDEFNRTTTTLTSKNNTLFISQEFSILKNTLRVTLNHKPPFWADRYKFVVKTKPLQYQTIFVNEFYNEGSFVWAKLVADNKDKVKIGDILIVKLAANIPIISPIKVKVLDIKVFDKDFIEGNVDDELNDIIETQGVYMQIRPEGFSMDLNDYTVNSSKIRDIASSSYPTAFLSLFTETGTPNVELQINQGSSIYILINSSRKYDSGWTNIKYENTFFAQRNYDTIEDWFEENFVNGTPILGVRSNDGEFRDYAPYLELVRGNATLVNLGNGRFVQDFTAVSGGKLHLKIRGLLSGGTRDRAGYVRAEIVVRNSTGIYVFETEPKQADSEIFFETEQTFDIINGEHQANVQNQNINTFAPAIIDLDFFNCYAQGNGVESYRVRDEFNTKFLNIDTRPSAVSIEQYKQVRRFADLTHGEPFIESSNINGLNEFNLAKGNFKELDKQYGSIQITYSRDGDIVVWQEDKVSNILFNKDLLFSPDGNVNLTSISQVLGAQTYYMGDNGIGKNPESLAVNDYQFFYVNSIKGFVNRLSNDGITVIMNGMVDYFRDIFITKPTTKKIGGFDPYHKQYFLSVKNEPNIIFEANCGNTIIKSNTTESLTYLLNLNNLIGDIVLNFNIIGGNATITAIFDGDTYVESNITGEGNITIPRTNINETQVEVTITPVGDDAITYEINNSCPLGFSLKVVEVVLNDIDDSGKTIDNRYKWGQSAFYTTNELFLDSPITRFSQYEGIEGQNRFPQRGSIVRMECYKKNSDTARLDTFKCNRLGYLVTALDFDSSTINDLLDQAIFLNITTESIGLNSYIDYGNFVFDRTNENEVLYLIYDFTDRSPEDQGTITIDNITLVGENNVEIVFSLDFETTSIFYRFRRLGSTNWSIESELETTESPQELFVATGNQDIEFQLFATNEIACNNIIYSNIFVLEYDELEPEP